MSHRGIVGFGLAAVATGIVASTVVAGCHDDVLLGTDPVPFCQGQPCGTLCTIEPCAMSAPDCGPPTPGVCDGNGMCTAIAPTCAQALPCKDLKCGASCMPLLMSGTPPFACTAAGTCEPGPHSCPPDPCHGLLCGLSCTPMCDPTVDGGCPPPPTPMACDAVGQCRDAHVVGCKVLDCGPMKCGMPCTICDPMNPKCPPPSMQPQCDPSGTCTQEPVSCLSPDGG